jgi:preprotein translocase subunit YajC
MQIIYQNYLLLAPGGGGDMVGMIFSMALIFGVMWFLLIRPQRKREKQQREMRSKLEVGDEIITIGGIIGRVVSLREDSLVIETGSDRSKIRITRTSVQQNNTIRDETPSA